MSSRNLSSCGYFALSHNRSEIAHRRAYLMQFTAHFFHALFFNRKLLLCDHMIVNTPNFRIAYQLNPDFRNLITEEFVELAHIELERTRKCEHLSLVGLREFYRYFDILHPEMPLVFSDNSRDNDLLEIERSVRRRFPQSQERDVLFTQFASRELSCDTMRSHFGDLYNAYKEAFRRLNEDVPKLGIIHFDRDHRINDDPDIFEYMSKLGSLRHVTAERLRQRFGGEVSDLHRAMLIKAEIAIIENAYPVLPIDLQKYAHLLWSDADQVKLEKSDTEKISLEIDLAAVGVDQLAALTAADLRFLRETDEARAYLDIVERQDISTVSLEEVGRLLKKYLVQINKRLARVGPAASPNQRSGRAKLAREIWTTRESKSVAKYLAIEVISAAASKLGVTAPAIFKAYAAKVSDDAQATLKSAFAIKAQDIRSELDLRDHHIAVRYRS